MKKLKYILLVTFEITLGMELGLRTIGFGNPILYEASEYFEYMYAPNQYVIRLGKRIITNEIGMRNHPNSHSKSRILGLGDSIINGGQVTDHNALATTIISDRISNQLDYTVEVLNVSCGSWGPDNVKAFLDKFGTFEAKIAFWVLSSHDYNDNMTFSPTVGRLKTHPDKKPYLAIHEIIDRYIIGEDYKDFSNEEMMKLLMSKSKDENPGIQGVIELCRAEGIALIPYLHPTKKEFERGQFDENGSKIINIFKENNLNYYTGLNVYYSDVYRDKIHLNEKGQKQIAEALLPALIKALEAK